MFGEANPRLVYGFNLNNSSIKLDDDWLADNYPIVQCYAVYIVRNYLGEAVYGIDCNIDTATGVVTSPDEKKMEIIKELYKKYVEYCKNCKNPHEGVKLGYHLAVIGWDEEEHQVITI